MFKTKSEVIEKISIGDNKYELRSNGIFLYSKNLKTWSPYAKRNLERHWDQIKTTSKKINFIRNGKN